MKDFFKICLFSFITACFVSVISILINELYKSKHVPTQINYEQLVKDYMKEYNIDKETAERKIRIDKFQGKKTFIFITNNVPENISIKVK